MNRLIYCFLIGSLTLLSCRNREELPPRNDSGELIVVEENTGINVASEETLEGIETIPLPIEGTWKVTEYSKEKIDQTNFFNGFTFTFNPDGSVVATKGDIQVVGTYEVIPIGDTNELKVSFPSPTPFPTLNYPWKSATTSEDKLTFEYTTKDLVFEKV